MMAGRVDGLIWDSQSSHIRGPDCQRRPTCSKQVWRIDIDCKNIDVNWGRYMRFKASHMTLAPITIWSSLLETIAYR